MELICLICMYAALHVLLIKTFLHLIRQINRQKQNDDLTVEIMQAVYHKVNSCHEINPFVHCRQSRRCQHNYEKNCSEELHKSTDQ